MYQCTNVRKPPKYFDYPEIAQLYRMFWFEEIPWVCYSRWDDRTYFVFDLVLKMYENLYKKPYQT